MLTATYTHGLGVPIDLAAEIKTPAEGLAFLSAFQRFLQEIPKTAPVAVVEKPTNENLQYSFSSQENIAWISSAYLAAVNKSTSFIAIGSIPTKATVVPGATVTLGTAEQVLDVLSPLIFQLEIAAGAPGPRLYSRKAVIGMSMAAGLVAALGAFAIGWARKDEPSSALYPGSY